MNRCLQLISAFLLLAGLSASHAATLSLPATVYFTPGESVAIDVTISDLGDHALGAFDINLGYGGFLFLDGQLKTGTALGETTFDTVALTAGSPIQLAQISLESAADLLANQPDAFTLATVNFLTSSGFTGGHGRMGFGEIMLSDENGNPLNYTTNVDITFISNPSPAGVPIPASWLLFATGLVFLGGAHKCSITRDRVEITGYVK
jgi:hypothetical protein